MATARNEITGEKLQTKGATNAYRSGWDAIFGKKEAEPVVEVEVETEEVETTTEA
jgi:hypothetical protein